MSGFGAQVSPRKRVVGWSWRIVGLTLLATIAETQIPDLAVGQVEQAGWFDLECREAECQEAQAAKPRWPVDYQSAIAQLATDGEGSDEQPDETPLSRTQIDPPSDSPSVTTPSAATELTPELATLRDKVRQVLKIYAPKHLSARDNSPWEVMHAIIAYGVDTELFKNGPGSETVNAIGWMCYNRPCRGEQMLFANRGKVDAKRGPGVQGHAGQFLAILAQSHLKSDYPLNVNGKQFTLQDLIENEKENCFAGEELTFKLIALMHYLDSDATWTTRDGQEWSIQRLVREELKQPIRGAACGGTHRLMGFSYAVNKRIQRGKPVVGEFRRAQIFLQDFHRYTFSLQNPDGSFSTEWFTRPASDPDIDRRLKTSGHILEWIAFSLTDSELRDPRTIKAVDYVSTILLKNPQHKWEVGPLGHGLHSLAIYDTRVFKPADAVQSQVIARSPNENAQPAFDVVWPAEQAD